MQIVENGGLIVKTRYPERITETITRSALLQDGKVLVKWGIREAQKLTMLGFKKTPSPIQYDYDYPGFDKPYAHQRKMAEFYTLNKRCFNFSDMGTSKSRSTIWAADYLMNKGLIKRALILSPLSIVETTWLSDIFKSAMHRTACIAVGSPKKRTKLIHSSYEFVIMNIDGVKSSYAELKKAKFDLIIVDECMSVANSQTDRWKALHSLVLPETYLWMMTGTPAANSPLQAYGMAKLVSPDRVPKFFGGWRNLTMIKISMFQYVPAKNANQLVFDALQPAIRFNKADCLDLPPVTYVSRDVPMDKGQQEYYNKMKTQMSMKAAGQQITAVNAGVLLGKLLQISCGAVLSDDGNVVSFQAENRLKELLAVIAESIDKVLVFAQFTASIELIEKCLQSNNIPCAVINGAVSSQERTRRVNDFQNTEQLKVLILQPRAAAHGLTLTRASTTVWFGPVSSLETWHQANARTDRPGQVNNVTIVKLVGSDTERKTYKVLETRGATQADLLSLYQQELAA